MKIISVNISEKKGTVKRPVPEILINKYGVVNDAHAGLGHRQISLLAQESIDRFSPKVNKKLLPGDFAENLTTEGIILHELAVGSILQIAEVQLEVTQIGKECHGTKCSIFVETGTCIMPKEGIFCKVLNGGVIQPNDVIYLI